MRASRMNIAALRLTILAIALQAMFLGTGGAVCLDDLPLPWLQANCPDPCCNTADECCPGEPTPVPSSPSWPALPDCCIGGSVDYGLPGQGSVQLADPALTHSSPPATTVPLHRYPNSATPSETRRPPSMRLVGVVLLQV
ncbi:MAG: hypothetical protein IH804_00490 [Planctomycetes bacterium]|nr:hypothetical protein [Planctomycetota bacterium]